MCVEMFVFAGDVAMRLHSMTISAKNVFIQHPPVSPRYWRSSGIILIIKCWWEKDFAKRFSKHFIDHCQAFFT